MSESARFAQCPQHAGWHRASAGSRTSSAAPGAAGLGAKVIEFRIGVPFVFPLKVLPLIKCDWSSCTDVERDPDRVSGAWVVRGTRVPVAALFANLEEDASVHQFIEWFPGVALFQARHVLEHAARSTLLAA